MTSTKRRTSRSHPDIPVFIGAGENWKSTDGVKTLKISVIGPQGVGKSALCVRITTKRFIGEYFPSLESVTQLPVEVEGEHLMVHLFDTALTEDEDRLKECVTWSDGVILVYSITDSESFHKVKALNTRLVELAQPEKDLPVVFVANKKDLEYMREVDYMDGFKLSQETQSPFSEVSVSHGYNEVADVFQTTVKYVYMKKAKASNNKEQKVEQNGNHKEKKIHHFLEHMKDLFSKHHNSHDEDDHDWLEPEPRHFRNRRAHSEGSQTMAAKLRQLELLNRRESMM